MHHAMNHVGFMIGPELHIVQDGVHGSPAPYMVQGELLIKPHLLSCQPFRSFEKDYLGLFLLNPNLSEILNAVSITSFFNVS